MNNIKTEIVQYQQSSLSTRATYANTLAGAADLIPRGLFDKATGKPSPAKILLVMETGAMLGLAPMAALAGIDVIEGKAAISPRVALGLFRSAGHKVKIIEEGTVEGGNLKMTVILTRKDDPENPIEASFTPQQGLRAGLIDSYAPGPDGVWVLRARSSSGKILPWEAYTEDLCLWRAVSRLGRRGGQDVLMGIGYIPEELDAMVDEDGVVLADDTESENELIARFKALTDKKDMRVIWREQHPMRVPSDLWTARVDAEFAAHLMTCTVDSDEVPAGAPGNTGESSIDEPTVPDDDPNIEDADVVEDEQQHRAEQVSVETQPITIPKDSHREVTIEEADNAERAESRPAAESEEERDARLERENYAQYQREQEAAAAAAATEQPAPAQTVTPPMFDNSALGGNK